MEFKPGQKVVRITDSVPNPNAPKIKKGEIVTIKGKCDVYEGNYDIVEYPFNIDGCLASWHGRHFAPLPEQRERINYVAVSETLRETAVEIAAIETN